ncbi:MAG: SDR family NAD(P)-dependent oxidoreductase [Pseudomonadota bacterium]
MSQAVPPALPDDAIAIVGMSGRFPGAPSVAALWELLRTGSRGIRTLSEAELAAAGVPERQLRDPAYVRARGVLEEVAGFDAGLFGMSPREAAFTDPQHRLFLECAFEALEDAAIAPGGDLRAGIYGGVSASSYFANQILAGADPLHADGDLIDRLRLGSLGTEKDFFTTRVSYRLDLRGPSVDVQSACSSSAVAVHLAAQALLMHSCDVALAGGASIFVPTTQGYLAQEGGVLSPDGHCRPFDSGARGTVPGSGVGVVVLRRLEDALADGDPIRAVLRGSAINNDGAVKVGFGAPGVDGQADVVAEALAVAGVDPDTIGFVETHGTGTRLGDPIEIAALRKAFGDSPGERCALGAIKASIGHLDAAAGVAGLIKAVLALEHATLPPQPEFEAINPDIALGERFYVPQSASEWRPANGAPRRASVSAFGIGGTNVHLVLEQAPECTARVNAQAVSASADAAANAAEGPLPVLLPLSAQTPAALAARGEALAVALERQSPAPSLQDVGATLRQGRRVMAARCAIAATDGADAAARLRTPGALVPVAPIERVVWLLPGQGAQRLGLARQLLASDRRLREHLVRLCGRLEKLLGVDPLPWFTRAGAPDPAAIDDTAIAQPLLFALEVALGRCWLERGVEPTLMLGHSLGELAAACLADVFSEEDGLLLVAARGRILAAQPRGSMLAVRASADALAEHVQGAGDVVVAAVNGPSATTLAGPTEAIASLAEKLAGLGLNVKPLATSHAFHSPLVDGAVEPFVETVATVELRAPSRAVISNVSGAPLTCEEATDPAYWGRQLREAVRFGSALTQVAADAGTVFVELGTGETLLPLAREAAPSARRMASLAPVNAEDRVADARTWLTTSAGLWSGGLTVALDPFNSQEKARRVPGLALYPFQRERHWVDRTAAATSAVDAATDADPTRVPEGRVWLPAWQRLAQSVPPGDVADATEHWLVVAHDSHVATGLVAALEQAGLPVQQSSVQDLAGVASAVRAIEEEGASVRMVYITGTTLQAAPSSTASAAAEYLATTTSLLRTLLGRGTSGGVGERVGGAAHQLAVVTQGLADVTDGDDLDPDLATILGALRVAPQEVSEPALRVIDVDRDDGAVVRRLYRELATVDRPEGIVALRGRHRWGECLQALDLPAAPSLAQGTLVVLIGGLGRIGRAIARWLVEERGVRVVVASRRAGDAPDEELTALAAQAEVFEHHRVDITDAEALTALFDDISARHGALGLVLHLANVASRTPLQTTTTEDLIAPLGAKVEGTRALATALRAHQPQAVVLWSSLASLLGGLGTLSYTAANAFLDAFATAKGDPWRSVSWDVWDEGRSGPAGLAIQALPVADAMGLLERILAVPDLRHTFVSTRDLVQRRREVSHRLRAGDAQPAQGGPASRSPRPQIATAYVAPRNEIEAAVAEIWADVLGLEQVGVEDPFFDLGGDSLLATMLLSKITSRFALDVPVERFFEAPTVASAARVISAELERTTAGEDLDALLSELEGLSDEEAARLLEEDRS